MSTLLTEPPVRSDDGNLSDLVEKYSLSGNLPQADWLTRLKLTQPRRNVRCLEMHTRLLKRAVDVVGATALLIVLAPVLLVVACLVKLTSRGPVLYSQVRVGLNLRKRDADRRKCDVNSPLPSGLPERRASGNDRRTERAYGREFVLYKFRTMVSDAEKNGAQWAQTNDPRITPLGRILRKTRLDELPQLWNVLRGEMSLVGPRPERPVFIQQLSDEIPDYLQRLGLKPGITGMSQVLNGYDEDLESVRRKVAFDLLYLQNCCLRNDLKILFRTVGVVLTGKGAK